MMSYFTRLQLVKYLAISHADSCNKSYISMPNSITLPLAAHACGVKILSFASSLSYSYCTTNVIIALQSDCWLIHALNQATLPSPFKNWRLETHPWSLSSFHLTSWDVWFYELSLFHCCLKHNVFFVRVPFISVILLLMWKVVNCRYSQPLLCHR